MGNKATTLEEMEASIGFVSYQPTKPVKLRVPTSPVEADMPQLESLSKKFEQAGKRYGVPAEVLAGIASRESRAGKHLTREGYDPGKKAYGVMQIDERFHKRRGSKPDSQEHIDQAAEILANNKKAIDKDKRFVKWTEEQRMQASVAAYNMGLGNVKTWKNLDVGTTGGDYSKDVMLRSKAFSALRTKTMPASEYIADQRSPSGR